MKRQKVKRVRLDTTVSEETTYGLKVIAGRLVGKTLAGDTEIITKPIVGRAIDYLVRKEMAGASHQERQ
jgi:hypothetical protein